MVRVAATAVLCVGLMASIGVGQLAGFFHAEIEFDLDGAWPESIETDLALGVEYALTDWTFGSLLYAGRDGLENLAFLAKGPFGALNVHSLYWLQEFSWFGQFPGPDLSYADWDNAIWIDVSGVELWGFFSVQTEDGFGEHLSGSGLAIGGHGVAGDVGIWAEMSFNLEPLVPFIYWNGLEETIDQDLPCDLVYVLDPTCSLEFSFAEAYLEFPFCCADVTAWMGVDCLGDFALEAWVRDIPIGQTALVLEWVDLYFDVDGKDLDLWFGLDLGEVLCVTPFVSILEGQDVTVDGIELDALELTCELGGVAITVSELFSLDDYYIGTDGGIHRWDVCDFGWVIPEECVDVMVEVEEAIGIEVRRDGCCGESFVGLYSFFDVDLNDALFDWLGMRARAEIALSSMLSMSLETWLESEGVTWIALGFDVTWGTLRLLSKDPMCCLWSSI